MHHRRLHTTAAAVSLITARISIGVLTITGDAAIIRGVVVARALSEPGLGPQAVHGHGKGPRPGPRLGLGLA